jgi:hypothetical protein
VKSARNLKLESLKLEVVTVVGNLVGLLGAVVGTSKRADHHACAKPGCCDKVQDYGPIASHVV